MIRAIYAALESLLTTDPTFVAAVQALGLGASGTAVTPGVLRGNTPLSQIPVGNLPTWYFEVGDINPAPIAEDADEFLTIGSTSQGWELELPFALVWHQQVLGTAHLQRLDLFEPLNDLFLRNPSLGGTSNAWLDSLVMDRSAFAPKHVVDCTARVQFTHNRS